MATQYQIEVLENKLKTFKPNERGIYEPAYYALFNKIKKLKKEIQLQLKDKRWNDFLAQ